MNYALAEFASLWANVHYASDSDGAQQKHLAERFLVLRQMPGAWKWLWRSKHRDAQTFRTLCYCLANWPFTENIPWVMIVKHLDRIIKELNHEDRDVDLGACDDGSVRRIVSA